MAKPVSKYPAGLIPLEEEQVLRWPDKYMQKGMEPWKGEYVEGTSWGPLTINKDNQMVQRVALAYSQNADSSIFRLHFDPEAVFADGTPFTAAAAKLSFEFGTAPENQATWGGLIDRLDAVKGIIEIGSGDNSEAEGLVVIDNHTLELRLTAPTAHFPWNLADKLLGFGNIEAIYQDPQYALHTPGIGPYQFEVNPDTGVLVATRSDHFWRDPPTLDGIIRQGVTSHDTRYIMYENAEIDVTWGHAGEIVRVDPNHKLFGELTWSQSGGLGWFFAFHLGKEPFQDKKVRMALAHAIDMVPIVDALFPTMNAVAGIINGEMNCMDPAKLPYPGTGEHPWSGVYKFDPEYARQLLAESTYGSAANLPPITVYLRKQHQINVATLMQEAWRDNLGVELNMIRYEAGQALGDDANILRRSRGTGNADPAILMRDMAHSASGLIRDLGWHNSPAGPVIDAIVEQALAMPLDNPARCDTFIKAERLATADYRLIGNQASTSSWGRLVAPWVLGFTGGWQGHFIGLEYYQIGKRDRDLYPGHVWGR
jgi:oligopeptide transport system substrate-binding protein